MGAGTGWVGFELGRGGRAGGVGPADSGGAKRHAAAAPKPTPDAPDDDRRGGTIAGVFYRHSGNPAAGGQVSLSRDDVPVASATADAGGRFSFPGVPPGYYELAGRSAWSAPGAEHDEHSTLRVHVAAGGRADVRLVPSTPVWTNVSKSL